jgi:glycosyltransferase involved in cell wall biosynthesis
MKSKANIVIGANNFDTLVAIMCKKLFFKQNIKKIVYFGSDFSQKRYNNKFLDYIYLKVEVIVLKGADLIVSNTKRAEQERFNLGLLKNKSLFISNGVHLEYPIFYKKEIDKYIYIGSVTKEHGLYEFIQCMAPLIKELTIIGKGDSLNDINILCKNKNIRLNKYVNYKHEEVLSFLKKFSGFGLAPYNMKSEWTRYCSPLKVNEYIACGLPVIMSNIPEISQLIDKKKLGVVYSDLNYNAMKQQIIDFDTCKFYIKSRQFYQLFEQDKLFKKIIL